MKRKPHLGKLAKIDATNEHNCEYTELLASSEATRQPVVIEDVDALRGWMNRRARAVGVKGAGDCGLSGPELGGVG